MDWKTKDKVWRLLAECSDLLEQARNTCDAIHLRVGGIKAHLDIDDKVRELRGEEEREGEPS